MSKKLLIRIAAFAALVLVVSAVAFGGAAAQQVSPIQPGVVIVGTIPSEGASVAYSFNGAIGDLVTIRVIGVTSGMDPAITLLGPAQETILSRDNDLLSPANASLATVIYRLFSTGTYTILVSGTPGDFILTLESQPSVTPVNLTLDTPTPLTIPFDVAPVMFAFNTDPTLPTTLHIDAEPFNLNATVEVRDGSGQLVALFQGDLDNACVSAAPGDELFTMSVVAEPDAAGTLTVTLSHGPCVLGPAPAPETIVIPAPQFVPIPIEGVCAASSFNNVNVRSGPGLQFPVIALWLARNPIQVIGRSADGFWWAVQSPWFVGWMSTSVVAVVGPCDTVPVIEFNQPAPAVTATPGLPAATPTPMATMTTAPTEISPTEVVKPTETTEPGQNPTATIPPPPGTATELPPPPEPATATVEKTPLEETPELTVEVTPTVTPTVGG
jgi:uncharacterized protein YraI